MGFNHLSSTAVQHKTIILFSFQRWIHVFEISKIMLKMVTVPLYVEDEIHIKLYWTVRVTVELFMYCSNAEDFVTGLSIVYRGDWL